MSLRFAVLALVLALLCSPACAQKRILGGTDAKTGQFPYQVSVSTSISNTKSVLCGGSILASRWIITAAHCVTDKSTGAVYGPENILVTSGSIILHDSLALLSSVKNVFVHPDFDFARVITDLALLELNVAIPLSTTANAVRYATESDAVAFAPQSVATVSGWGYTTLFKSAISSTLQFVRLPIVSNSDCAVALGDPLIQGSQQICAGGLVGQDSCSGDSGGPLTVGSPPVLVGIVSWGQSCGTKRPAVYTRVATYSAWITNVMATKVTPPAAPAVAAKKSTKKKNKKKKN